MKLPSFFSPKKSQEEYYFGLLLNSESASGFVLQQKDKNISIIAQEECKYSNGWEQILEDTDGLISNLESQTSVHLTKVIFFLHSYLIDNQTQEIKNPYKDIIKNIAKSLELKPLGFIEIHEAVKEYIHTLNQAPLNCIFIELDTKHLTLYMYKGDKEVFIQHSPRTENLIEDIEEILNQSSESHFPSKIIISGLYEEIDIQAIQSHNWKHQKFVQTPKIDIIKENQLYNELKEIFAEQIFQEEIEPARKQKEIAEVAPADILGFAIGEDVALNDNYIEEPNYENEVTEDDVTPAKKFDFLIIIDNFKNRLKLPKMSLKGGVWIWIAALLGIILGFLAFEYYIHKIALTVYVPAKKISRTLDITAPIGSETSGLFVHEVVSKVELSEEKQTTGERETGQKAKGDVIVHNFDNQEKTIAKGTQIVTDSLVFTLDQEVKVVAATGSTGTKESGKSKVSATAAEIGPESNIDKGKELKIADLPDSLYIAVADTNFTGGSKKKVKTVARKDMDDLEETLLAKAKKEEVQKIKQKVQEGEGILADLTEVVLGDTEFSSEIGEEANKVTAKGSIEIRYYIYPEIKFKEALLASLKSDLPSGHKLQADKLSYSIEKAEKDDENKNIALQVKTEDKAIKDISQDEIVNKIKGKTWGSAVKILESSYEATDFTVEELTPSLSIFRSWTPIFKKNLDVSVSSK